MSDAVKVVINGVEYAPIVRASKSGTFETFGAALKAMRKQSGMTLNEASDVIGCSKSYLSELENDRSQPSLKVGLAISEAYGVSLVSLAAFMQS